MQRRAAARVRRARRAHRRRAARLVRPRAAPPAVAGTNKAWRPTLTAYGSARSCCSRRRSRRCCRATPTSCAAGPTWRRWRAPSSARCSPPGPASAITRARATCMPAPARWWSGMAASFPHDEAELRTLPGIGDYTAAAIAAIAFGERATPVDGNIERVVARLFAVTTPLPAAKPEIRALAEALTPETRAGDFAQAMMDLGATICTPRRPACGLCPLRPDCRGYAEASPRRCPIARRRASGRSGAARLRRRPRRRCRAAARAAAAWPVGRHAGDAVIAVERGRARAESPHAITRRSRPTGASCPGWSSTLSRISIWSFPSIVPRSARCAADSARRSPSAAFGCKPRDSRGRRAAERDAESARARARRAARRQACGSSSRPRRSRKASIGLRRPSPRNARRSSRCRRARLAHARRSCGSSLARRRRRCCRRRGPCASCRGAGVVEHGAGRDQPESRPERRTGCAASARLPLDDLQRRSCWSGETAASRASAASA